MQNSHKYAKTYCNPTPLPNYPLGRVCVNKTRKYKTDYRETADPSVIYENGIWYLYPSCGMVYWSEDFIHWKHKHMEPYDIGYAPTVVKHNGRFLLTACEAKLYESNSPLGPFECIGAFKTPDGKELYVNDPMLFSDDDGRLYLYSGCGVEIRGAELDPNDPTQLITSNDLMFAMNTKDHEWERLGEWNHDPTYSWTEGAWMYKRNGTYYLTYSAPGTEWCSYAMGAYKSKSPKGPWEYMKTSPFLLTKSGIIRGTGHGSIVDGPNGTAWVFYTCCVCYGGAFERRIGYDPIGFDENGDIIPTSASENPSWAPGVCDKPYINNSAELVPLTQRMSCEATSCAPGRDELYALDDSMITWWQPDINDPSPSLTVSIAGEPLEISSVRVMWRDVGLDIERGILPGAFGYTVDAKGSDGEWICVLDKSKNDIDMIIDYEMLTPIRATKVRINITKKPIGIEPGLISFTVFGPKNQ
ncbi:MAG: family 43 glycosylhydrolase [Clostridia bacterium]|nr:family 43 glycosylhydrolase [Clostridia bacterium]